MRGELLPDPVICSGIEPARLADLSGAPLGGEGGGRLVILPNARSLPEYHANSIRHLLPEEVRWEFTPAAGGCPSRPPD